jgi:uncharacterized protein YlzI (FlbEa/FlbD family)
MLVEFVVTTYETFDPELDALVGEQKFMAINPLMVVGVESIDDTATQIHCGEIIYVVNEPYETVVRRIESAMMPELLTFVGGKN